MDATYKRLIEIGIALSAERDFNRLMQMILVEAKALYNADGGTLYLVTGDGRFLRFAITLNDTLKIAKGGATGVMMDIPPLPLYTKEDEPNHNSVATHVALSGRTINIPDAYAVADFDFSGAKKWDALNKYRSKSFLTVPMKNHEGSVIGVLQLINARSVSGKIVSFAAKSQSMIEALASQAAVALEKQQLLDAQRYLFMAVIAVIGRAIDAKSPYTGGHCGRVPVIAQMLAQAACSEGDGPFASFELDEDGWYALTVAAGLHDCGKMTTQEYVVDKASKLETIYNRIHEIRTRFEVLKRDAKIAHLEAKLRGESVSDEALDEYWAKLDADFAFIAQCNEGGEFMDPARVERLKGIAQYQFLRTLDNRLGLSYDELMRYPAEKPALPVTENVLADNPWHLVPFEEGYNPPSKEEGFNMAPPQYRNNLGELYNLQIARGTLNAEERFHINDHMVQTIRMLNALPFPKAWANVPEIAGGHHERMDGKGYPKGLVKDQLSIPARIMAIADVFEALTASDRPYKKPKSLSETIKIMAKMRDDNHIDGDLFALFLRSGVYIDYAEKFLQDSQIDEVDIGQYI